MNPFTQASLPAKPYVYKGVHKTTGQFYIGYRSQNKLLAYQDLGFVYKTSSTVVEALGFDSFNWEIIDEFLDGTSAFDFENKLIEENINNPLILNKNYMKNGQKRFKHDFPHTEEAKKKISIAKLGKKHSEESRKNMGNSRIGKPRPRTPEHALALSKALIGTTKIRTPEHNKKLGKSNAAKNNLPVTCPHCNKTGGQTNMHRYHFDKCKVLHETS